MQRAWATGTEQHDQGPLEWISAIDDKSTVPEHLRTALAAAVAPGATIAQCQAGVLAIECVTYVCGGDADLDPTIHFWMRDLHPRSDEALRTQALAALAALRTDSALAAHWQAQPAERSAEWQQAVDALRDRLTHARRKPDPGTDPRVVALGKSFPKAQPHLRVALVPYAITDEPIAHLAVAPDLTAIPHYDGLDGLEPVPVPLDHQRGWNRSPADLVKAAAKQTRERSEFRTHIIEHPGFEIAIAFGSTSFTAGLLPHATLLSGGAPHGLLVGAPHAGAIAYHKIVDGRWNEAAVELVTQLRELYAGSAHRISPRLFWLHKGKLVELPYAVLGGQVAIQPIDAFVKYVAKLT